MGHGLFRQEVLDARKGSWLGSTHVATPITFWVYAGLAISLAAAILGFLVFGHYTRRSRVAGQLVPTLGLLSIRSNASGSVDRVFVHAGQHVRRGDALVGIASDTDSATLGDVHADISRHLHDQYARLKGELSTQRQSNLQRIAALTQQINLLRRQMGQIHVQRGLQNKRVASDRSLLTRIRPLADKGYVSAFRVQQLEAQLLQDQTQAQLLARQQLGTEQQISDARQKRAQAPLDLKSQTDAIQRQVNDIEQKLAQNEVQRAVILRAPSDGTVTTLLASPGQAVVPGESLASILPRGSRLQAQLLVPSRSVGFIAPGSRVVLRYQAYPYQKFGQQYGHILSISRSALTPSQLLALTGQRASHSLYRVKVRLDRQSILVYGKPQALRPGMALNADILMDRRSLLEWVFDPLYGLGRDALATRRPHA